MESGNFVCAQPAFALRPDVEGLFVTGKRYRRAGVLFFGLEKEGTTGTLFWGGPSSPAPAKLSAVADSIKARLGRGTVFFAVTGISRKWHMKREMHSSRFTARRDGLLVVK